MLVRQGAYVTNYVSRVMRRLLPVIAAGHVGGGGLWTFREHEEAKVNGLQVGRVGFVLAHSERLYQGYVKSCSLGAAFGPHHNSASLSLPLLIGYYPIPPTSVRPRMKVVPA